MNIEEMIKMDDDKIKLNPIELFKDLKEVCNFWKYLLLIYLIWTTALLSAVLLSVYTIYMLPVSVSIVIYAIWIIFQILEKKM